MSRTIKNVAIAGASGNVGAQVLRALLDLNFNVTVLTRSPKPFPPAAPVKLVDFTSVESLSSALTGQDAVIDTTFSPDIEPSLRLIDAAAEKGVNRLLVDPIYLLTNKVTVLADILFLNYISITSDFGLDPEIPGIRDMPVFSRKKASYEAVKNHAAQNHLTYTLVACGAFLDWGISSGFSGLNFQEKKAFIFGDGENVLPWTTLEDVGKATANVLLHPEETLNRVVYIHSVFMSQNQLLSAMKEVLGSEGWETTYNDMEPLLEKALADLKTGNISAATFEVQIKHCMAARELAHPWVRDDNSLLGLEEWSMERVEGLVREIANSAGRG